MAEHVPYEEKGDGFLFSLRDDVKMLVKWATARKVTVEFWRERGDEITIVPPDTGDLNSKSFRKRLADEAKLYFFTKDDKTGKDVDTAPNLHEDVGKVAVAMNSTVEDAGSKYKGKTLFEIMFGRQRNAADFMLGYAKEYGFYFHNAEMETYATVTLPHDDHEETYPLNSRRFTLWLRRIWWERERQRLNQGAEEFAEDAGDDEDAQEDPSLFPSRAMVDVVFSLEAMAMFAGPEEEVFTRVAGHEGMVYIDLGDPAWRVVEISPDGWRVISSKDAPVRFVRAKGMMPLPEPTAGTAKDLEPLREILNLGDPATAVGGRNWSLVLAWLVQAFSPTGPYPVLTVLGPQGAAKSTAQKILRNIVDPSSVPLRSAPRDEHNLYIDAISGWVIALDNMGSLPAWLSDALCRLATGGGFSTRRLYTDQDQILFSALRPTALNGIGDVIARPDLLDRALIINLPSIPREKRKLERFLEAEVELIKPAVLGALFSAVSAGLINRDSVVLESKPRMADFAVWGVATEKALGGEEGTFMAAYDASQEDAVETALESWPVVEPLASFALNYPSEERAWVDSATKLLEELNERVGDDVKRSRDWPKQPNKLTEQLNRLAPSLEETGVFVVRSGTHKGGRKLKIWREQRPD